MIKYPRVIFMPKIVFEKWKSVHIAHRIGLDFTSHVHDEIEIVLMISGSADLYCDGKTYNLHSGDLSVVFPNHTHGYENTENCEAYIAIAKSSLLSSFGNGFTNPESPVITPDSNSFEKILSLFCSAEKVHKADGPYRTEKLNAYVTLITAEFLPYVKFIPSDKKEHPVATVDIFSYCNGNFDSDITLDSTAEALNISKYHIMRIFREKFNTTFQNYINGLRIDKAKELLTSSDKSVTEISILCGFNTIRSFNRVFLQFTGLSPSDWRKANR